MGQQWTSLMHERLAALPRVPGDPSQAPRTSPLRQAHTAQDVAAAMQGARPARQGSAADMFNHLFSEPTQEVVDMRFRQVEQSNAESDGFGGQASSNMAHTWHGMNAEDQQRWLRMLEGRKRTGLFQKAMGGN